MSKKYDNNLNEIKDNVPIKTFSITSGGINIKNLGQPVNIDTYEEENKQLKQQLLEKDTEISMLKSQNQFFMEETKRLDQISNLKDKEIADLHTTINQDAVEIMMLKDDIDKRRKFIDERIVEKDKEIERLKANQTPTDNELKPQEYDNYNLADKLRYRDSQVRIALERLQKLEDELFCSRHKICEEIRKFVKYCNDIKTDKELAFAIENGLYFEIPIRNIFKILDQIEKENRDD